MTFFTVVTRGLMRRPVRTGLTIVGIAIGIAAVVALVGISRGFETSWQTGMKSRGTDIVVSNMGKGLTPNHSVHRRRTHHSASTCRGNLRLARGPDQRRESGHDIVSARQWGGFSWKNLKLVSGRLPND
jgi:putative ABC transport system permease protein